MKELKKEVNEVFTLISSVFVRGDDVDVIAIAREKLRKVYSGLSAEKGGDADG